ncbi:MAG: threonylcarbamoyl-AMP synthase [Victivallaceae bacterium]|nr:threonylcarbamoyl-AMP synthase [Victivallaceae bacterium]
MTRISAGDDDAAEIAAAALARPGAVILVPTETVYGLVSRFDDEAARARIFALKRRPSSKVLGCFVRDVASAERLAVLSPVAKRLAGDFWPGPLTMVLPAPAGGTIGIRIPDHPFLLDLIGRCGGPLAQTSANVSGQPDAPDMGTALEGLDGEVDIAVDGGPLKSGFAASTVVDLTGPEPRVLREGALTKRELGI